MEKTNFWHEFIAGNVAGLIGNFVVYPLDTVKIRMQTYSHYTSILDVMKKMVQADGFLALYRGVPAPAMGYGVTFALCFSSYGASCRQIAQHKQVKTEDLELKDLSIAGAITGLVQSPARQVVERFKSVMQVHENSVGKVPYKWTGSCCIEFIRKEGIRSGVFQGFGSVLLREIPQFAIYYPSYEFSKKFLTDHLSNATLCQFLAGGIAGTIQWLPPIFCFDVIKSRMQTAPRGQYSGILDCASQIYRSEGYAAFFRGFTPAMFRAFPLHAIIFLGYESVIKFLHNWD